MFAVMATQGLSIVSEIETDRLILRLWTDKDFDQFAKYYSDENNAKYEKTIELLKHGPHRVYRYF